MKFKTLLTNAFYYVRFYYKAYLTNYFKQSFIKFGAGMAELLKF